MMERFGFSYIGLIFLLLLCIPNILWASRKPKYYTPQNENRALQCLERTGEVLVSCCSVCFPGFNWHGYSAWAWWLFAAAALMVLYELWWVRYFRSERTMSDFYSSFLGVPVAGATLPVLAFFLLGIYGKLIWMMISAVILGIGHIGMIGICFSATGNTNQLSSRCYIVCLKK